MMETDPNNRIDNSKGMYRDILTRSSSDSDLVYVKEENQRFARQEKYSDVRLVERWTVKTNSLTEFFAEKKYYPNNRPELNGVPNGGLEIRFETRSSVKDPWENSAVVTLQLRLGDRICSASVNTADELHRDVEFSQVVAQALQDRVSQRFIVYEGRVEERQAEGFVTQDSGGILGNISLPSKVEYSERDNPIDHSNQEKKRQAFYDLFMLAFSNLAIELHNSLKLTSDEDIFFYLQYFDKVTISNILASIGFNALEDAIMGNFPTARREFLQSLNNRKEEYEQTVSSEDDEDDDPLLLSDYEEDEDSYTDNNTLQLPRDSVVRRYPEVSFPDFARTRLERMNIETLNIIGEMEMLQDIALHNMKGIQDWSNNLHRQLYGSVNALRELNPDDLIVRLCLFKLLSEQNRIYIFNDVIAALAIFINSIAFRGETTPYGVIEHKTIVSGSADYPDGRDILTNRDIKNDVSEQQREELRELLLHLLT